MKTTQIMMITALMFFNTVHLVATQPLKKSSTEQERYLELLNKVSEEVYGNPSFVAGYCNKSFTTECQLLTDLIKKAQNYYQQIELSENADSDKNFIQTLSPERQAELSKAIPVLVGKMSKREMKKEINIIFDHLLSEKIEA